jgi:hypothetical protein
MVGKLQTHSHPFNTAKELRRSDLVAQPFLAVLLGFLMVAFAFPDKRALENKKGASKIDAPTPIRFLVLG